LAIIYGYVTSFIGYCIGYISNVLLFVARTPDPRNTTAPRRRWSDSTGTRPTGTLTETV
jgi:hypothetical protein